MSYSTSSPPFALTIAGSDCSAGAGVQADLKAFAAHGVYGLSAVTAVVAESPGSVSAVSPVDPPLLGQQLNHVRSFTKPCWASYSCIKIGMLGNADLVGVVVDFLRENPEVPVVVDPVIRASASAELLSPEGVKLLRNDLLPLATLVTPNLPEAEILLEEKLSPESAAQAIAERFGCAALVKGGHSPASETITDHAWIAGKAHEFPHPRLNLPDLHGTGCTLSSAIAARISLGNLLLDAVGGAISYLTETMNQHLRWPGSDASRALNHFPDEVDFERT